MIIETFRNELDGLESRIYKRDDGKYSVSLFDTDVEQPVLMARIYDELQPARVYACRLAMAN
ncbi:hypothetical protein UFOVP653_42 [uncultured Caudovirales phage]|uniref:Uncharacterized protein n=1 Tax=uncultured Caudovirales phage TaxID=2100421 RepID=A0A6J5NCK9_9CAUD|nr:hypothetical protein UFOVP653_42 [uncultured Caudovirales phage]